MKYGSPLSRSYPTEYNIWFGPHLIPHDLINTYPCEPIPMVTNLDLREHRKITAPCSGPKALIGLSVCAVSRSLCCRNVSLGREFLANGAKSKRCSSIEVRAEL